MKAFLMSLVLSVWLASGAAADTQSFDTPEGPVEAYITGVKTGSGAHVERAFTEIATIKFYDPEGTFQNMTRDAFVALVNSGNAWDAKIEITQMLQTERVANATVEFTFGENGEHGFVDYLNLMFAEGSWRITDKVSTYIARK